MEQQRKEHEKQTMEVVDNIRHYCKFVSL